MLRLGARVGAKSDKDYLASSSLMDFALGFLMEEQTADIHQWIQTAATFPMPPYERPKTAQ